MLQTTEAGDTLQTHPLISNIIQEKDVNRICKCVAEICPKRAIFFICCQNLRTFWCKIPKRYIQGVPKKTLFNEIGTPGGPKTIDRVGDQSKMLSNTLYWSDVPIYPF